MTKEEIESDGWWIDPNNPNAHYCPRSKEKAQKAAKEYEEWKEKLLYG